MFTWKQKKRITGALASSYTKKEEQFHGKT